MRKLYKQSLSFLMIFSIIYSPILNQKVYALDPFCDKPLEDVRSKKSTQGDQVNAYCVQAEMAREAQNVEIAKSIIYIAGLGMCAALISGIWIGTDSVCEVISMATAGAGIVADITGKIILNKSRDQYGEAREQVCSVSTFTPAIMQLTPLLITAGSTPKSGTASHLGCIMCMVMNGLTAGISIEQSLASNDAKNKFVESAKSVKNSSDTAVTSFSAPLNQQAAENTDQNNTASTPPKPTTESCASKGGNQYLSCMGQFDPEISAISNNPELLSEMTKGLHGKNLGDFIKGYKGETKSDLANYVAGGLGVSPAFMEGAIKLSEKMMKDTKFAEKYHPSGFTRTASAKPSVGADLDFSKIMAGMMEKMDPNAGKKEKEQGGENASEKVFRQLDLLPADKIQANKDISLFARIAFRYRKNSTNVDQVEWSRAVNKDAPAPASATEPVSQKK